MLQNLHVKNLALIDEVEITFDEHLNILTGETGAGKSVLIGSIESALGKKISKDMKYVTQNLVKNSMLIAIFVLGIVVASYFVSVIGYSRKK